jgi:putative transposase
MNSVKELSHDVGVRPACHALGVNRSSYYRDKARLVESSPVIRPKPALALTDEEEQEVMSTLNSEEFMDKAPKSIFAELLETGRYLCSVRTMYRLLTKHGQSKERRNQVRRPHYKKPELLATRPNEVWSWDITKLKGPAKWTYFYLYVIMDIFSRYVVGWMVAHREQSSLAKRLIEDTCFKQNIQKEQLTLHADRGSSMTSKQVAHLLADLGITKSHSRPQTSNDNPYSESQFKTMKYRPEFPQRFGCAQDARSFSQEFFGWYNTEHRHSGISFLTPEWVHYGKYHEILDQRNQAMRSAFEANTARFKYNQPKSWQIPQAAWINKPKDEIPETAGA